MNASINAKKKGCNTEVNARFSCFLLHHGHSCITFTFPSVHEPVHCSCSKYTIYFNHPFIPSCPGSLRQEVLQLQLSTKASLKGNSSDS